MTSGRTSSGGLTKVICVGLHKTSTTSLANALYTLGYHVGGFFDTAQFSNDDELTKYVIEQADFYDAVQDMPWPEFYRLLDDTFPGSKFILTVRDEDRWIRSVVDHFGEQVIDSHVRFYGVPVAAGHEDLYREFFRRHNQEVVDYFAGRPDDLLVMDIAAGDGWEVLGDFLGVRTPDWPFPRQNTMSLHRATRYQRRLQSTLVTAARRAGIDQRLPGGGVVDALSAYPALHDTFRDVDDAVERTSLPPSDLERGRIEGVVRLWLDDLLAWAVDADAPVDASSVSSALDAWQLDAAWEELRLAVRQWSANLTDDGGGARDSAGSPASGAVTRVLRLGADHGARVDRSTGTSPN